MTDIPTALIIALVVYGSALLGLSTHKPMQPVPVPVPSQDRD